jgi:uncharacterized protein YihD (DUF1040 family)
MRDINRIDRILAKLGEVWKKYPQLRLGQLILNVINEPTLYYMEDQDLIDSIIDYYKKLEGDN